MMLIGEVIFLYLQTASKIDFTLLNAKQLCDQGDDITIVINCRREYVYLITSTT